MQNEQNIFKLHSEYAPTGDQPQAIDQLVRGFKEGNPRHYSELRALVRLLPWQTLLNN